MVFVLGVIVGLFTGVALMCILAVSKDADLRAEILRDKEKDE